jgi:NAD(P)-dependent dehydrogenase (short-subunit alcohol dehydrogenase family)
MTTESNVQNLRGKIAIVTGSNAGIGQATASSLLRKACHIIMACRSQQRATEAMELIKTEYTKNVKSEEPMPTIEFMALDLASLESARNFVNELEQKQIKVDYLINNAGAFFKTHDVTKDGFEQFFHINYLSHFLLTHLILEKNLLTDDARIISLSSGSHKWAKPGTFSDEWMKTNGEKKGGIWQLYGISKLCMILLTRKLQKDFTEKGSKRVAISVDPGFVKSELGKSQANAVLKYIIHGIEFLFAKSADEGASTTVHCVVTPIEKLKPGMHYIDSKEAPVTDIAKDGNLGEELQKVSLQMCGLNQ